MIQGMRKNRLLAILVFIVMTASLSFLYCAPPMDTIMSSWRCGTDGKPLPGQTMKGCWQDEDSYRVTAAGLSGSKGERKERRMEARKRALLTAQFHFIDDINKLRMKRLFGDKPPKAHVNYSDARPPAKEFGSLAARGRAAWEEFDSDNNCRLLFEIREKGLKQRVRTYLQGYERLIP